MRGQALVAGVPLLGADVTLLRGGPGQERVPWSHAVAPTQPDGCSLLPCPGCHRPALSGDHRGSLVPAGGQAPRRRATPAVRVISSRGRAGTTRSGAFQLSSAIGRKRPWSVVVNDLTTGAAGFALAQFVGGGTLAGASPGFDNAAAMAANLVDFRTGGISTLMRRAPNGRLTDTLPTLNTLANIVSRCAVSATVCRRFSQLVAPVNRRPPVSLLQTVASVARNPAHHASGIFGLQGSVDFYRPRLLKAPAAWLLAVKFTGNGRQYNGPGNIAFDAQGNVWATNNYVATRNPADVCAGTKLFRLRPTMTEPGRRILRWRDPRCRIRNRDRPAGQHLGGQLRSQGEPMRARTRVQQCLDSQPEWSSTIGAARLHFGRNRLAPGHRLRWRRQHLDRESLRRPSHPICRRQSRATHGIQWRPPASVRHRDRPVRECVGHQHLDKQGVWLSTRRYAVAGVAVFRWRPGEAAGDRH
jgi:hypothetical protein